jgi:hypothetical protein
VAKADVKKQPSIRSRLYQCELRLAAMEKRLLKLEQLCAAFEWHLKVAAMSKIRTRKQKSA